MWCIYSISKRFLRITMSKSYNTKKYIEKNPFKVVRFGWTRDPVEQVKESKKGKVRRLKNLTRTWEEYDEEQAI